MTDDLTASCSAGKALTLKLNGRQNARLFWSCDDRFIRNLDVFASDLVLDSARTKLFVDLCGKTAGGVESP